MSIPELTRLREFEAKATAAYLRPSFADERDKPVVIVWNNDQTGEDIASFCGHNRHNNAAHYLAMREQMKALIALAESAVEECRAWRAGHDRADLIGHLAGEYGPQGIDDDIGAAMAEDIKSARAKHDQALANLRAGSGERA